MVNSILDRLTIEQLKQVNQKLKEPRLEENWLGNLFWFLYGVCFIIIVLSWVGILNENILAGFLFMLLILFFLKSGLFKHLLFKEGIGEQK